MLITNNQLQEYLPLYTERLVLRKIEFADAPALFAKYTSDPDVTRNASWKTHQSVVETEKFLATCLEKWEASEELNLCICFKDDPSVPIGMFKIKPLELSVNIGYVLAKEHWNKGYTTEAVKGACEVLFGISNVTKIEASTDSQNFQSMAVLKKAGFQHVGTLHSHIVRPQLSGNLRDSELFILKK